MENTAQFYGPSEIIEKVEADGFVTVTLKRSETDDTYQLTVPTAVFERVVTAEAKDWNYVQEKKLGLVQQEMLDVLTKHGVTGGEIKFLIERVTREFYTIIDRAVHYRFTNDDKSFVPGSSDLYFDYTLNQALAVIKEINDANSITTTETPAS